MADGITVTVDTAGVRRLFDRIAKESPKLALDAINHGAFAARKAINAEIAKKFDRPTPYTLNALFVAQARRNKLQARVWFKDLEAKSSGRSRGHYLTTQTFGGVRAWKQFEARLNRVGALPAAHYAVPSPAFPLDAYGNPKRSEITKIMSWLGAFDEIGYSANKTAAGKAKAKRGTRSRRGYAYFMASKTNPRTRHLRPGIYLKTRFGFGWAIKPMLLFVPQSGYTQRLRFFEVGYDAARDAIRRSLAAAWKQRYG